jgi:tetratricopeptide (TPR) repeat protein
MGQWKLAHAEYKKALELGARGKPTKPHPWVSYAALHLPLGDREGLRQFCASLYERHGANASDRDATALATVCLLAPGAVEPARVLPLVDRVRDETVREGLRGAVLYDLKDYQTALQKLNEWTVKSDQRRRNYVALGQEQNLQEHDLFLRAYLALAHYRLGNVQAARLWLGEAGDWHQRITFQPSPQPPSRTDERYWPFRLACQALSRKAEFLIDPPERRAAEDCMKKQQWVEAIRHFDQLLAADPAYSPDRDQRGHCYAQLRQWDQAAADLEHTLRVQPNSPSTWYFLAMSYLGAGKLDEHRQVCAGMLARFANTHDPNVAMRVVFTCVYVPDAVEDYNQLLKLALLADRRDNWHARTGAVLYRMGQFDAALQHLEKTIKSRPNPSWPLPFAALVHHRLGNPDEARYYLEQSKQWVAEADRRGGDVRSFEKGARFYAQTFQPVEFATLIREAEACLREPPGHDAVWQHLAASWEWRLLTGWLRP